MNWAGAVVSLVSDAAILYVIWRYIIPHVQHLRRQQDQLDQQNRALKEKFEKVRTEFTYLEKRCIAIKDHLDAMEGRLNRVWAQTEEEP